MTYERINFVDQSVERPRTYEMIHNADGSVTFVDSFGLVDELGTPINADTMNHLEDGIAAAAIRIYNESETFALGDWVLGIVENEKNIYKSLQDNNVGNSLNDKNYWEVVELGSGGGRELFDIVQKDHILSYAETEGYELLGNYVYKEAIAGSRYGYPDFYNKCLEEKNAGTATQVTLGENTVTMYVNANGHQFFDIANKDAIDVFYEATGSAWFYGVDTANERILLPRYDYVELSTKDKVPVVGNGMTIGYTIGDDKYAGFSVHSDIGVVPRANVFGQPVGTSTSVSSGGFGEVGKSIGLTTDSEKSGIETSLTAFASEKYYYMVVGNTAVESAVTDVVDVTTSENDTLPLFHNFWSKEDMTTTGCYVNASLGSFLSGNVYTTAYNTLVQKLGTGNVKSVSSAYTDYDFVVNADDMTFRLPLKNGQEVMFATGVKGNGIAIGFTNGTDNVGIYAMEFASGSTAASEARFNSSAYGTEINTQVTNTGGSAVQIANGVSLGITTDSSKSGIILDTENITIPDGWNLYYKVANAVQNLELLDVAGVTSNLNRKVNINSDVIDGQWVAKTAILTEAVTAGVTAMDLSDYLPKDNYQYEVLIICAWGDSGANDAAVYSDIIPRGTMQLDMSANGYFNGSYITMPVGTGRVLYQDLANASTAETGRGIEALAYRRIGTNQ